MKKSDAVKGIVCIMFVIVMLFVFGKIESTYSTEAKVCSVENNVITFEDKMGNLWEYEEEEGEEFEEGQSVKLVMNDNYTKEFEDDEIIKVKR